MIFCNLGSGSKGNSTFIKYNNTAVLIDQGFSIKEIVRRLNQRDLNPLDIKAIILTHEHSDHISGVAPFARRYKIPVYMTELTYRVIKQNQFNNVHIKTFTSGESFKIFDLGIKTFKIPHDAADPIGLVISSGGKSIGILTDIGSPIESLFQHIDNVNLLLLESNHDLFMLLNSPYPLNVIQRIKSRLGHLSNDQALYFFRKVSQNTNIKYIVIGHISETNNDPMIINEMFSKENNKRIKIEIALQNYPSNVIKI